ncbi:helix-turn-helix domain-containing protein [Streptomyces boninensis]|uniref:helix-turn-helix domain-containing protein n=1 Tax=Streptomyces boninensis TaxID=2039455 RepID=UPI003B20C3EF
MSVIAERVREARARHGFTAQILADKLKHVGVPWDRATVTKVETGRRQNITVVELLALARVLDVAPVHLLVPVDDRPYQVTPGHEAREGSPAVEPEVRDAARVRAWVRGEEPLPSTDRRIFRSEVPLDEMRPTTTVRFGGRHGSAELEEAFREDQKRRSEEEAGDGESS